MPTADKQLVLYKDKYRSQIIELWEKSVRATHHFLHPVDIDYYKDLVEQIDFTLFPVYCLVSNERVLGFIGVHENKVEMLFLDPSFIGKGYGKRMMKFAMSDLDATKVDVNEQNTSAVAFYLSLGFVVVERNNKDSEGRPYPILKLKLETRD